MTAKIAALDYDIDEEKQVWLSAVLAFNRVDSINAIHYADEITLAYRERFLKRENN